MATYTPKRLVGPVQLGATAAASLYTPSSGASSIVKEIVLTNTTANPIAATIYIVPSGGSVGASNTLVPGVSIAGNSFIAIPLSQVMNNGDNIWGFAGSGSSITVMISGVEFA